MIEYKKPEVVLMYASPLWIAEVAGRVCYNSFGLSENEAVKVFPITKSIPSTDIDTSELVDKLVNVHFHESVVEHVSLSYYITNISREIVIELNRHRIGIATSQMSTRYTIEKLVNSFLEIYGKIPVNSASFNKDTAFYNIIRNSIVHNDEQLIDNTVDYMYRMLVRYHENTPLESGLTGGAKKKQNDYVKRMLPESWMLSGVWTFNLRALKHLFDLRLSGAAYYGIRELVSGIAEATPDKYRIIIDKKHKANLNTKEKDV